MYELFLAALFMVTKKEITYKFNWVMVEEIIVHSTIKSIL